MSVIVADKWAANPLDASVSSDAAVDWKRAMGAVSDHDALAIALAREVVPALTGALK